MSINTDSAVGIISSKLLEQQMLICLKRVHPEHLKSLARASKPYIKKLNTKVQHGHVLNFLAEALGVENHDHYSKQIKDYHSLCNDFSLFIYKSTKALSRILEDKKIEIKELDRLSIANTILRICYHGRVVGAIIELNTYKIAKTLMLSNLSNAIILSLEDKYKITQEEVEYALNSVLKVSEDKVVFTNLSIPYLDIKEYFDENKDPLSISLLTEKMYIEYIYSATKIDRRIIREALSSLYSFKAYSSLDLPENLPIELLLITINELKIIKIKNNGKLHNNSYPWMSWCILTKQYRAYEGYLYIDEKDQIYSANVPPTMLFDLYVEGKNECLALLCQFFGNEAWHNFFMEYRTSKNEKPLVPYYEFADAIEHDKKARERTDVKIIKSISELIDDNYKILLTQMWESTLTNLEKKLYIEILDTLLKSNKKSLYFNPSFYNKSIDEFDTILEELFFKLQFDSDEYHGQSPVFDYEHDNNQYRVVLSKEAKQFFSKKFIDEYFKNIKCDKDMINKMKREDIKNAKCT